MLGVVFYIFWVFCILVVLCLCRCIADSCDLLVVGVFCSSPPYLCGLVCDSWVSFRSFLSSVYCLVCVFFMFR